MGPLAMMDDAIVWYQAQGLAARRHLRGPARGASVRLRSTRCAVVGGLRCNADGDARRRRPRGRDRSLHRTREGTGRPLDIPFAHVWRFQHGKAVRFHQFTDTRGWTDALAEHAHDRHPEGDPEHHQNAALSVSRLMRTVPVLPTKESFMKISKSAPRLSAIAGAAAISAITAVTLGAVPAMAANSSSSSAAAGLSCSKTLKIAMVTPLTGGAAFLGQEQISWARYAVKTLAPAMGLKIQLLAGDTPVEQGPAPAQTLAQKYAADPSVVGIIGPSTSGAVVGLEQDLRPGRDRCRSRRPRPRSR